MFLLTVLIEVVTLTVFVHQIKKQKKTKLPTSIQLFLFKTRICLLIQMSPLYKIGSFARTHTHWTPYK